MLPIDKIIARFYPIFGICLIIMAVGIAGGMLFGVGGHTMPEMVSLTCIREKTSSQSGR